MTSIASHLVTAHPTHAPAGLIGRAVPADRGGGDPPRRRPDAGDARLSQLADTLAADGAGTGTTDAAVGAAGPGEDQVRLMRLQQEMHRLQAQLDLRRMLRHIREKFGR